MEQLEDRLTPSVSFTAVAAGDATNHDAILWTRALNAQQPQALSLIAEVSTDPTFSLIDAVYLGTTDPAHDYTVKVDATGLQSGTQYFYRFLTGDGQASPVGKLKTAPDPTAEVPLHFGFSGDADGKWRPYDATANFAAQNFDYFTFLGDTIYETASTLSPAATDPFQDPQQALLDYWRKYREQLQPVHPDGFTGLQTFFASQGNYTLLDNHELGNRQFQNGGAAAGIPSGQGVDPADPANDVNTTGSFINKTQGFQTLVQAYSDYQPIRERTISAPGDPRTDGTQQLYFAQQWGAHSVFFNLDDRSYRDIQILKPDGSTDNGPRADNPDRTMLGATQLEWFKQSLLDAQANGITWKFVAISSPIDQAPLNHFLQPNGAAKTWDAGYRAERNQLLKFIADNHIDHVVFLTTDLHQLRVSELTYLRDPSDPNSVAPVPGAFQILAGPIGAGGPDGITDHSFPNIKSLADNFAADQIALGMPPIGLHPSFPGLSNVFREGDPNADTLRQPVDFYSPDTFNYATLDLSPDGGRLAVSVFGINSFAANTFPEPNQVDPERLILSFQINDTLPTVQSTRVNDGSAQRSMVNSLTVTFSSVVHLDPGAFDLVRLGGGAIQILVTQMIVDGHSVDTLTFSGAGIIAGSLADGHYTLTIHGGLVHDDFGQALDGAGTGVAGSDSVDTFCRLFGDSNGDGHVDLQDLLRFGSTFGKHAGDPGYLWYFDYDGDGRVDIGDLAQLLRRFR